MKIKSLIFLCAIMALTLCLPAGCRERRDEMVAEKPVIYLYPERTAEVSVELDYAGELTCTYPKYNGGWRVIAAPDGALVDINTKLEHYCLFWEGRADVDYDMSEGFVIKGGDSSEFLEDKLALLGLNPRERNEFMIYWLPRMERNAYNLIAFQNEAYTDNAKLAVDPAPDCVIRVFMAFKPLEEPVDIAEQTLIPAQRHGFTVVEWGGAEVK